jgi:RNA polymerase sigma-70 factor (ECF subfamily)
MLRALRFFGGFRGGSGRSWLLAIVRNTVFDWMKANRPAEIARFVPGATGEDEHDIESIAFEGDDP